MRNVRVTAAALALSVAALTGPQAKDPFDLEALT